MKRLAPPPAPNFATLGTRQLHALADLLREDVADAVEQCIAFIEADTLGNWHNRARAMMSRRLKHCSLTAGQRDRLVQAIVQRLVSGRFAQQFKDQLRLALQLDATRVHAVARSCAGAQAEHTRRYAAWVLSRELAHG